MNFSLSFAISICNTLIHFLLLVTAISISKPKDVMLGSVKIPLVDLIHKRTGMYTYLLLGPLDFLMNI